MRNLIYIICYSFVRYLRVNKTLSYIPFLFHFTHTSNICGGGLLLYATLTFSVGIVWRVQR